MSTLAMPAAVAYAGMVRIVGAIGRQGRRPDRADVLAFRAERAKLDVPTAMRAAALAMAVMALLNWVLGMIDIWILLQHLLVVAFGLLSAALIARPSFPAARTEWVGGAFALSAILDFQIIFHRAPDAITIAYVLMIMVAAGYFCVSSTVYSVVGAVSLVSWLALAAGECYVLTPPRAEDWFFAALTAQALAAVILRSRTLGIDELGRARRLVEELAEHDRLTGLYNRHGLEKHWRALASHAHKVGAPVSAWFVDIDGLKAANDLHGHDFGDQVIRAVADAVREELSGDAIAARWGGDEFLVLMCGPSPSEAELVDRVTARLRQSGVDAEKWPGRVSIGVAHSQAAPLDIERLIGGADSRMYQLRYESRAQ